MVFMNPSRGAAILGSGAANPPEKYVKKKWKARLLCPDVGGNQKVVDIEVELGQKSTKTDVVEAVNRMPDYFNKRVEFIMIKEVF